MATDRLRVWRTTVLNTLLIVTSVAAGPMVAIVIVAAIRCPEQWPAALAFSASYLLLIGLTVFRRLDFRVRAWGLLLLIYAVGALALARGGLAGDGRLYLLALPMLALLLLGLRASLATAALSLLTFAACAVAASLGWMSAWLVRPDNSLLPSDWLAGGVALLLTLAVLMALQWRYNQLQEAIATENRTLYQGSEKLREFNADIVQNINEGLLIEDTVGRITFANPRTAQVLGYTIEELVGQHWEIITPPERIEKIREETAQRPQGIANRYETTLLTRDNRRVPVIVSAHPLFEDGQFTGVLTVLTDITEHKQAEEKLKEYRDHLEELVEQRSAELLRANQQLEQEIVDHEQAEEALRRRNRELAMLNRTSRVLSSTIALDRVLATVLEEVRSLLGVAACSTWLTDSKTGELICQQAIGPQSKVVQGWRLAEGEGIAGWVARAGESLIVPDVQHNGRYFEQVDLETGLGLRSILSVPLQVKSNVIGVLQVTDTEPDRFTTADLALLEPLAGSAAIAIDNARLVEALRQRTTELQARNEELDAFAHTVAHDLKNSLTRIIGFAEILTESYSELPDGELLRYLQTIAQNGRKMDKVISELLLLAVVRKLEEVDTGPLNMGNITSEALERVSDSIQELGAEIILPERWVSAVGYGPWVEEVWFNYISNALKYGGRSEQGITPRIELGFDEWTNQQITHERTANSVLQHNSQIRFWVRDNGPGLTPDEQAHLFTPLTRLGETHIKGYGLGLSIVQRVVRKLGGQVGVESQVGEGSLFFFTLPAA